MSQATPPSPAFPFRHAAWAALLSLAAVFIGFFPVLSHFPPWEALPLFDATASDAWMAFQHPWPFPDSGWRPVAVGLAALETTLFGPALLPRMILHLGLLALAAWLVGLCCQTLTSRSPFGYFAGGLWLCLTFTHPPVYDLGAQPHLLGFVFLLVACLVGGTAPSRPVRRVLAGLAAALSFGSSEIGLFAPLMALLYAGYRLPEPRLAGVAVLLRSTLFLWPLWGAVLFARLSLAGFSGFVDARTVIWELLWGSFGALVLTLSAIQAPLRAWGRGILVAGLVLLGIGSFTQLRRDAADWREAGEVARDLREAFVSLPPELRSLPLVLHDVPERIGKAPGITRFPANLTGRPEQAPPVVASGPLDAAALREALLESPDAPPRLVWSRGRLLRLEWAHGVPSGLGIGVSNCSGTLHIEELRIVSSRGSEESLTDFRNWEIEGAGRFTGPGELEITRPPVSFWAPATRAPRMEHAASLHLSVRREEGHAPCTVLLSTRDPRAPSTMNRRALSRQVSGAVSWRLSGLDPALRSWWRHASLRGVLTADQTAPDTSPPEGSLLASPTIHKAAVFPPSHVERVRLHLEGLTRVGGDLNPLVGAAELWGWVEGEARPRLLEGRLTLPDGDGKALAVSLPRNFPPLSALALALDASRVRTASVRMDVSYPLVWPVFDLTP